MNSSLHSTSVHSLLVKNSEITGIPGSRVSKPQSGTMSYFLLSVCGWGNYWGVETEAWTLELDKSPECEKLMSTTSDRTSQTQFLPHQLFGDASKMAEIMHVTGRMVFMKFSSVFSPQGLWV